jgi:anaerobic dimethyl sulfoxide reductase subunit C (anchor subunit)
VCGGLGKDRALWAVGPLMVLGLLASFLHLGTPLNAWRVVANLRSSWLSREILFALLFTGASALFSGLQWLDLGGSVARDVVAWLTALLGLALIVSMANAYRLRTIPAWNTGFTLASFLTTAFLLGELAVGATLAINPEVPADLLASSLQWIATVAISLLCVQLVTLLLWIAGLAVDPGAASRAAARITHERRAIFRWRLALAVVGLVAVGATLSPWGDGARVNMAMILAFGLVLASEVLGRLLFYEARVRHGV